ncbi:NAD-binding protein, partial [Sphingomonas sp. 179-A 2A2 NHS]|uniref:NAD-binding protein n=1 Tax=Sphingomonas sp. 179-A 2A2 NHS TaxID=3374290 RepID=UPI00387932F7
GAMSAPHPFLPFRLGCHFALSRNRPLEAAIIAKRARAMNPDLRIIARAHSEAEVDHLQAMGADAIVLAEKAAAAKMAALVSEAESEDVDGHAHLVES